MIKVNPQFQTMKVHPYAMSGEVGLSFFGQACARVKAGQIPVVPKPSVSIPKPSIPTLISKPTVSKPSVSVPKPSIPTTVKFDINVEDECK